jgi:hypothetical protein
MKIFKSLAAIGFAALFALTGTQVFAGEGHDHGEASSQKVDVAIPRFTAVSESFELVGVVSGKQVTVYLDRFANNSPVKDAQIELDLGGVKVPLKQHTEGEYEADLPAALKPGVIPVVATVIVGQDTDLLAGELDLHDADRGKGKADVRFRAWWQKILVKILIGLLVISLIGWGLWRLYKHFKHSRNKLPGDSA